MAQNLKFLIKNAFREELNVDNKVTIQTEKYIYKMAYKHKSDNSLCQSNMVDQLARCKY